MDELTDRRDVLYCLGLHRTVFVTPLNRASNALMRPAVAVIALALSGAIAMDCGC